MGCCCSDEHGVIKESNRPAPLAEQNIRKYFQNKQGLWIRWRLWDDVPAGMPVRGIVVIVHGFAEYIDRYDELAKEINRHGMLVAGVDHQGHGHSEGDRGHVQRFSDYVDDLIQFSTAVLPANLPATVSEDTPYFLFGHSMGGLIASTSLIRSQKPWRAAVISAAAVTADPKVATPAMRNIAGKLSNMMPKLALDKLDPSLTTRDVAVWQKYAADPLVYHGGMRARWGHEMLAAMDAFWLNVAKISLPILLIHGTDDKIIPVEGSEKYLAAISSQDKSLIKYPGFYHEAFNDPGKEQVVADILAFFVSHVTTEPFAQQNQIK